MAGFDEQIVREYFELHGFLVRQARKYQIQSRKKLAEEEIDLLVYNPAYALQERKPNFLLFATELPYVHRAVVVVKAWHTTQRFTPTMLKNSAEFFKFLEKNVIKTAESLFQDESEDFDRTDLLKVLVLPGLPTQEPHRSESIQLLREHGVDGIISFRSMLLDILQKVEVNRNYSKSDTLQILRILKNYDLVKDPQLGLFPAE
jgi:hypothetical protein|tara:strand:- start:1504 stop:2112 length:609 start_codon:yes stop_codon:yes gene_type:complete